MENNTNKPQTRKERFNAIVSTISAYVDQVANPLITKSLIEGDTMKYIQAHGSLHLDVKYSQAINIMDQNPYYVVPNTLANAGFTDTGSTVFTQVNLTVCNSKMNMQIWIPDLETTYLGIKYVAAGSYVEDVPAIEEVFAAQISQYISQFSDSQLWMGSYNPVGSSGFSGTTHSGDTAGTGSTIGTCNGFLANMINNGSNFASATTVAYSAVTVGSIYSIVDKIVQNLPANILNESDISIFCPIQYIPLYVSALIALNLYHANPADYGAEKTNSLEIQIPFRNNVFLRGVVGLSGIVGPNGSVAPASTKGYQGFFATNTKNMHVGVDALSDTEGVGMVNYYSHDAEMWRHSAFWKISACVAFPAQVVLF